ncbi:hypothetical protein SGCZBJ_05340 [Caulobacter zeae]|uniref:TonB C-terminal domain-containing protein n=1 Tax=Caulobacter zeae TaxID=2055137 RepID=A0A2N5DNY8_9CAUL|nr:TonB family protein [Caulobacter zeae]PLR27781.1 hypothetical protein SGCZBJ_05340 [Caulobacter zeae]
MSFIRFGSVAALLVLAGLPTSSNAAEEGRLVFAARPKASEIKAAFPAGATVTGDAEVECVVADKGALADCKVLSEYPMNRGFGAAALGLADRYKVKVKDEAGASSIGRKVSYSLEFLAPGDANPNWVRKPTGQDLAGVFPVAAVKAGKDGRAVIRCRVTTEGFLDRCAVLSESPAGLGFGHSALALAPQFLMSPKIRAGQRVETEVTVPINWAGLAEGGFASVSKERLILDPPWKSAPSLAQVEAAWPKAAAGEDNGQAALRCGIKESGALDDCEVISELPKGKGFGKAALGLADHFKVSIGPGDAKMVKLIHVDVPFRFRPPGATGRQLTKPRWIQMADAEGLAMAFPQAARKAGVKNGLGVVSCTVTIEGRLADCEAAREEPAGLDFAASAMIVAGSMRMNPWTKEGDPVDGQRIRLPIRFEGVELEEEEGAAEAPTAAAKP